MRGTPNQPVKSADHAGIIPAYAGNTNFPTFMAVNNGDHPRVCGEHNKYVPCSGMITGSSPRMRGTPPRVVTVGSREGIIPAYAGNTVGCACCVEIQLDHPRVCGEHTVARIERIVKPGSSPRMRGTHFHGVNAFLRGGIIPAYAGNTWPQTTMFRRDGDHPRVCGEHMAANHHVSSRWGSSPRMRGTLSKSSGIISLQGIIPAYAGNTSTNSHHPCDAWDHPRVCGEHPYAFGDGDQFTGSSPRMRGTPIDVHESGEQCGIIPAYAGNTMPCSVRRPG